MCGIFDYARGVPANLLETGGAYTDLYEALKKRSEKEAELAARWEKEHPKKVKVSL